MTYAFLIAAHTDIEQLKRLVIVLKKYGDIYVHVDKKSSIEFYNGVVRLVELGGVFLTDKRISCAWGGWSQCIVQRLLLEKCLNKRVYDRIFFLSGLDYPLVGVEQFNEYFNLNKEVEFVCGWNVSRSGEWEQLKKIQLYHFFRDLPLRPRNIIRLGLITSSRSILKYLGFRKPASVILSKQRQLDVYYGSSWTSLTYGCAKFVLQEMLSNKKLVRYFKTSYAPDEMLIPTIVFNSTYSINAIAVKERSFSKLTPLHYLRYTNHIWVYDESSYTNIMNSGKIFVRKLVSGKSEKLIEMINKSIL